MVTRGQSARPTRRKIKVARGEVWLTVLDPTLGSEIQKTRPCVIISPPEMHDHLHTVLAAPMTTGSRSASYRVSVRFNGQDGFILLDQIRALDGQRLIKRLGEVDDTTLVLTLSRLRDVFAD